MSNWAHFRRVWLRPEVYPLIGAMGAAIGVCGFAIVNKTRDSIITWDKSKRKDGMYFSTIDEYIPAGNGTKAWSTRIFEKENVIYTSKSLYTKAPPPVTLKIGGGEEEEEEEVESPVDVAQADVLIASPESVAEEEEEEVESPVDAAQADEPSASPESVAEPPAPAAPPAFVVVASGRSDAPSAVESLSLKDESLEKVQAILDAALKLDDKSSDNATGSSSA